MSREATGQISRKTLADGTHAFQLRFTVDGRRERRTLHERRHCECGCGGGWTKRTAAVELDTTLAKIKAGVWRKPRAPETSEPIGMPTFHQYASAWLQAKREGAIGDRSIDANTEADYRWRLARHLLPFFARYGLDEIDGALCQEFKATKLREASELREAIAAGADLRDERGRRVRPLGPASIRKLIDCLASILDEAVEDGHIDRNPARGRRMRLRVPKPARTFLEMDELVALTDAAAQQDPATAGSLRSAPQPGTTAAKVAERLASRMRPAEIAKNLGLAKSTVSYHARRLGIEGRQEYVGRRAVVATLGGAGLRASELCDVRLREVRLHDPQGARLRIPDAKTEAGIREVQLSPDLVDELLGHIEHLRAAGFPTGPDGFLFPNVRGGRMSRQRVNEIVRDAARLATERFVERGLPPLPNTTPHSLRRTYISIALLANQFDVMWVMSQVGHADSKMTTDVYAQLQQRAQRDHGQALDALVRRARDHLNGGGPSEGSGEGPQ
jgi:integrase